MPMLTVAGFTLEVSTDGATQSESDFIGGAERVFDGSMRSSRRGAKRNWRFTVISDGHPTTQAEHDAFRAAIEGGSGIVTCGGEALSNATLSCLVTINEAPYHQKLLTHVRSMQLTLQEA